MKYMEYTMIYCIIVLGYDAVLKTSMEYCNISYFIFYKVHMCCTNYEPSPRNPKPKSANCDKRVFSDLTDFFV